MREYKLGGGHKHFFDSLEYAIAKEVRRREAYLQQGESDEKLQSQRAVIMDW